jgi:hypothetical protein
MVSKLLKMQLLDEDDELAYTEGADEGKEQREADGRPTWMKQLANSLYTWAEMMPKVSCCSSYCRVLCLTLTLCYVSNPGGKYNVIDKCNIDGSRGIYFFGYSNVYKCYPQSISILSSPFRIPSQLLYLNSLNIMVNSRLNMLIAALPPFPFF